MSGKVNLESIKDEVLSHLENVAPLIVSAAVFYVSHDLDKAEVAAIRGNINSHIEEQILLLNDEWFISGVSKYGDIYHCCGLNIHDASKILHDIGGKELLEKYSLLSDFEESIFVGDFCGKKIITNNTKFFKSSVWRYDVIRYHPYRKDVNLGQIIAELKESLESQGYEVEVRGDIP